MSGRLAVLAERQSGVVGRGQLRDLGIDHAAVAWAVETERWSLWGQRVVVLHNSRPRAAQLWWAAVLHASDGTGEGAALCSGSALQADGFDRFVTNGVHVVVRRGVHVPEAAGVVVHESRRFSAEDIHPARLPPRTRTARSAVDAAAWSRQPRRACAILAAVVQQRMTTVNQLRDELDKAGRVRHRRLLLATLTDIEGGAHSLAEIRVGAACRQAGLRPPDRQVVVTDKSGRRRYLDCEWRLPDGRAVVLEVDGAQHMEIEQWWADMPRERGVVLSGRTVLRCSAAELRTAPRDVTDDLRAAGVPRLPPHLSADRAHSPASMRAIG
jgi:hypothetical protein